MKKIIIALLVVLCCSYSYSQLADDSTINPVTGEIDKITGNDEIQSATGWTASTGNVVLTTSTDNIGVGKSSPVAQIDIEDVMKKAVQIKRTSSFDFVQYKTAAGVWTDITTEAAISYGTVSGDVLGVINDTFIIGDASKFSTIYIDIYTAVSTGGTFAWEYSTGGDSWSTLTATDGTATALGSLAQDGVVSFTPPGDWATDSQNGSAEMYFVRLRVTAGAFTTEPRVFLVVPTDGQHVMEVYANGGDTGPSLGVSRNGAVTIGHPNTVAAGVNRFLVNGPAAITGALAISGTLTGATSIALKTTATYTVTTTGFTHVGGPILNGPAATAAIPTQNSPVARWSSQAWNGSLTRINAMDLYLDPDSEPVTSARLAFKATTVDGIADASEIASIDMDGKLCVIGRAQQIDDMFDRVFSYVGTTWTDQTLTVSSFGTATGDVMNVVGDYVYFGKENQFTEIYLDFGTIMSAGTSRTFEYWDGDSWETLSVTDGTTNWSADGSITFSAPVDWALGTVNSVVNLYWVRIGTASGTFATEPRLRVALPSTTAVTNEVLSNNEFDDSSKWTATGDWAYSTLDYTFTYSSGVGTLKQASADYNSPLQPNSWYRFRYTVGVAAPETTLNWIGEEVAIGKTYFSGSTTEVDVFFRTNSNPGDFTIYTTASATSGFRLDAVFLKPVYNGRIYASGDIRSDGVFKGNGTEGIKVLADGNVGIGTLTPTSRIQVAGSLSLPYRAITALRTLDATDYVVDCTANTFTVTLPTSVGIQGRIYTIKNSGTGVITIDGAGTETLDGDSTIVLSQKYQSVTIQSDNANWIIIGGN
jgi:hypothetical protein